MQQAKHRISKSIQPIRHLIQLISFLLFPGLFLSIFQSLRDVIMAVASASFSVQALAGQLILLVVVLTVTALWGRIFCGFLCIFGAMQDLLSGVSGLLDVRYHLPGKWDHVLKYLKYFVLGTLVVAVWGLQLPVDSSLSPFGVFGMLLSGNTSVMIAAVPTIGFALLCAIMMGSFFLERFFCRYLCPLGALFTPLSAGRLFHVRRDLASCTGCQQCSRKCSMGISVHTAAPVRSGECIDCMSCLSVCSPRALKASPNPAIAGTASAFMLCGLVGGGQLDLGRLGTGELRKEQTVTEQAAPWQEAPEQPTPEQPDTAQYADGVYTGTGTGFRGETKVQVTVESGKITDITILSYKDDTEFFTKAQKTILSEILSEQSLNVSTVSGATFSSRGILEAVANALGKEITIELPSGGTNIHHGQKGNRSPRK